MELKEKFIKVYDRFKLDFYRNLYLNDDGSSLTVLESFCLEVINSLENATVKDVAEFMKISQPNAAYKIANLEKKGFITKTQSDFDKRSYILDVTDKYMEYSICKNHYLLDVMKEIDNSFSDEEKEMMEKALDRIIEVLPAVNVE